MTVYCVEFDGELLSVFNEVFSTIERAHTYISKVLNSLVGCKNFHEVEGENGRIWVWNNIIQNAEESCIIREREIDVIPEMFM